MGRLIRGLAWAVLVLAVLVGLPVGLVVVYRLVRWDWPAILAEPASAGGLLAAGIGVGWLVWGWLAVAVIADAVAGVRRVRHTTRLPVPVHAVVTAAAGAIVLVVEALRGGSAVAAPPAPAVATDSPQRWPASGTLAVPDPYPARSSPDGSSAARSLSGPDPAVPAVVDRFEAAGVRLPGGWLPVPVAAAVGAAAALLWTHRRRGYQPQPPGRATRTDPDLTAPTVVARRMARADRWWRTEQPLPPLGPAADHHGGGRRRDDVETAGQGPCGSGVSGAGGSGAVVGVGPGGWWPVSALPAAGVTLTGPGAADAARGVLTAVAVARSPAPPLLCTPGDVRALLGADVGPATVRDGPPRLIAAPDLTAALHALLPGPSTPGHLPTRGNGEAGVVAVLLAGPDAAASATVPPAHHRIRIIHLAVAAPAPHRDDPGPPHPRPGSGSDPAVTSAVWYVDVDGTVHPHNDDREHRKREHGDRDRGDPGRGRLATLDALTAGQLLTSAGLLHPSPDTTPAHPPQGDAVRGDAAPPAGDRHEQRPTRPDPPVAPVSSPGRAEVVIPAGWPDPPPAATGPRRLVLRVLGHPSLGRPHADGSVSDVTVRRSAGWHLLLLLAVHRQGLTRDGLLEAIWPDVPGSAARRRLATTLSELRHSLHDAAGQPVLHTTPATAGPGSVGYRLTPGAVQVDLWRFDDLLDTAATPADPRWRRRLWHEAADLYRGDLATGVEEDWLPPVRERVARHALDLFTHLADDDPDHRTAIDLLHRAHAIAPGNQAVYRRLLRRHAATGDLDQAHRAVATLTDHLTAARVPLEPSTAALLTSLGLPLPQSHQEPATTRPR